MSVERPESRSAPHDDGPERAVCRERTTRFPVTGWLQRPGYRLHWRIDGRDDGPWLVLAHSLGSDLHLWDAQVAVWGPRWRILRYDLAGHGGSEPRPAAGGIEDEAADAVAVLDHVGVASCAWCGLSLGGMIGQWLGAEASARVSHLVLCSTAARIPDPTLLRGRITTLADRGLPAIADSVLAGWLSEEFRAREPARTAWAAAMFGRCSAAGYAAAAEAVCRLDLTSRLPRIRMPTLVVAGSRDRATPPAWNRSIADSIPGGRYAELDGAHLINVEDEARFTALVGAELG